MKNILVVGAGFSGVVIARTLADNGLFVTVIDKRSHVAGNAYDYINDFGIRIHKYGPHIFHTSNDNVVKYLNKFTEWIPYKHKVKAMLSDGQLVTLPVNRQTSYIVGEELVIETFIRPYSEKMWGLPLEEIAPDVLSRVPIRDDDNELYFPNDTFQAMPKDGYTALIDRMLQHSRINIELDTPFDGCMESKYDFIFNSMPIDEYFGFKYGKLPYRSIKFHNVSLPLPRLFPVSVVNFTHNSPFTRITEWSNFPGHGANVAFTSLTYEEPCDYEENNLERYYPVKDSASKNRETFLRYLSDVPNFMKFIGRCGNYAYLDMHQVISSSLAIADKWLRKHR